MDENFLGAVKRYENIEGAPFSINQNVQIVELVDPWTISNDEEYLDSLIGKQGVVEYYEYDCGSGQTFPHDPMIGVRIGDGMLIEFWPEELTAAEH